MNLYFMLALQHTADPCNSILVDVINKLERRGIRVDIGIAQNMVLQPDRLISDHDLFILKSHSSLWLSLAGVLYEKNAPLLNPYPACKTLENKIITTQRLKSAGVPVPDTWVTGDLSLLQPVAEEKPLIVKPNTGARGEGIHLIRRPGDLLNIGPSHLPWLVQEFIPGTGEDLKVYAIGGQIFGVRKAFSSSSFRAPGSPVRISPEIEQIAIACGRSIGLSLYGLDVIEGPDGPFVVDLNYFPSYKGVPNAADLLSEYIISYTYDLSPGLAMSELVQASIDSC